MTVTQIIYVCYTGVTWSVWVNSIGCSINYRAHSASIFSLINIFFLDLLLSFKYTILKLYSMPQCVLQGKTGLHESAALHGPNSYSGYQTYKCTNTSGLL